MFKLKTISQMYVKRKRVYNSQINLKKNEVVEYTLMIFRLTRNLQQQGQGGIIIKLYTQILYTNRLEYKENVNVYAQLTFD